MKKWLKRLAKILIGAVLLLALLETGLYVLSRTQWFDTQLENALKNALGREVNVGHKGINLRGVFVEDIQIAEKGGFENGTFVQADRLRVHFSLWHLFHAHAQVDLIVLSNATVRVSVYKDGTSSWDDLTTQDTSSTKSEATASGPSSLNLTAQHIRLEHLHLIYGDEQAPRTLDIDKLTLDVKNFSLARAFPLVLVAEFYHKESTFERRVALTLNAMVDLAQLELEKANVHIKALKAFYKDSSITLSGDVKNFVNPQADLKVALHHVSSALFEDATDLPAFDLPQADLTLKLASDLEKQTVTLHHLGLQAPGVDIKAKGGLSYKKNLEYEATAHVNLLLGELGRWFTAVAEPYQAIGTLESDWFASNKKMTADLTLREAGAQLPHAGRLANVNGQIAIQESMDFKTGQAEAKFTGKLNANLFELDLTAKQTAEKIKAVLNAKADELLLPTDLETTPEAEPAPAEQTPQTEPTAWPLPPIELKANIQLNKVNVPYFAGKDIVFTSDLDGITPDLNQAHGMLHLSTGPGKIQDIYKLTDANALTKVLFLSLNVTGKVFNSLNVFGVLNSLGSGVVSAVSGGNKEGDKPVKTQTILGPDGEPLEVPVTDTDKQVSGEMEYDKFDTEVNFVRGLATIKEGTFVSPMMSFRLDGSADFNSGKLDMTVHAAPGRHEVDGMMPLSLKIGGTVDDPQGDMQVLGSVTSLVTQSVTNNVVSRNVTKGIKGIFGLFKKKEKDIEEPENTAEPESTTKIETTPASPNTDL